MWHVACTCFAKELLLPCQSTCIYYYWPSQRYQVLTQSSRCKSLLICHRYSFAYLLAYLPGAYGCGCVCVYRMSKQIAVRPRFLRLRGALRMERYCIGRYRSLLYNAIFMKSETREVIIAWFETRAISCYLHHQHPPTQQ